jgi:hypothetical protein
MRSVCEGLIGSPVVGVLPHLSFGVTLLSAGLAAHAADPSESPLGCPQGRHHSPGLANRTGAEGEGPEGEGPGRARVSLSDLLDSTVSSTKGCPVQG